MTLHLGGPCSTLGQGIFPFFIFRHLSGLFHVSLLAEVFFPYFSINLVKCILTGLTTTSFAVKLSTSLAVKLSTSLVVKQFLSLAVKQFTSLAVKRFTSLVVKRSTSLAVKRPSRLVVRQFTSSVVRGP